MKRTMRTILAVSTNWTMAPGLAGKLRAGKLPASLTPV